MSRHIVTLLMHWQITFLIILPLLSAQMTLHLFARKLKSTLKHFHLIMLKYTTGPSLWKSCMMLCVEPMIPQQDQMKYTIRYLNILTKIWLSSDFPLIPIPKPSKDPANPTNYRPIALTSCICKTMERMINRRLVWYLESTTCLLSCNVGSDPDVARLITL